MAVFFVAALLVVVFGLAVLLLVAAEAAGRAGGDQTQLAARLRRAVRHLNGEADPPAAIAETLIVKDTPEVAPGPEKAAVTAEAVQNTVDEAKADWDTGVAERVPGNSDVDDTDDARQDGEHLAA